MEIKPELVECHNPSLTEDVEFSHFFWKPVELQKTKGKVVPAHMGMMWRYGSRHS